jgi:hypothetical protein
MVLFLVGAIDLSGSRIATAVAVVALLWHAVVHLRNGERSAF